MDSAMGTIARRTCFLIILVILSGCGGGAGEPGSATPPVNVNNPNELSPAEPAPAESASIVPMTFKVSIGDTSDDAEEFSDGQMRLHSTDLEFVEDPNSGFEQSVGLRFQLNVPPNSTITDAYIQFTVDESSSTQTDLTVRGEKTENAAPFMETDFNISNRAATW